MSPFPKYQRCLGMTPHSGTIEILDRYIRVAFNVKLAHADESCLYENFESQQPNKPFGGSLFNLADLTAGFEKLRAGKADREKIIEKREARRGKTRAAKEDEIQSNQ